MDEPGDCPACGAAMRSWRQATAPDPRLRDPALRLARCPACGSARTLGPAAPAAAYEASSYGPARGRAGTLLAPLRALAERDRRRALASVGTGDRALEIGSGDGRLLAGLQRRGVRASGIEPSPAARARAAGLGVTVHGASVEEVAVPGESLDAVIAWHSLEHVEDPGAVLQRARGWVRPGGLLVLAVPNLGSLQARIGGDRWFHQDVPRHRTHFTVAGARALARRSGFRPGRVRHLVVEQNPLGMWQTLLNRVCGERDVAYRALKGDGAARSRHGDLALSVLAGVPLAPLAIGLELLAAGLRRGGTIVLEARAEPAGRDGRAL